MAVQPEFLVEALDASRHRRDEFACESPELTDFLRTRARKEMKARASACFVLVPLADRGRIAGYYTLSATSLELQKVPDELARRLPRYPSLPATLLGRLARDLAFKGQGLGNLLMVDALQRAYKNSTVIGSVAVVVDPKDDPTAGFYAEFGFKPLDGKRSFLPMNAVSTWLGLPGPGDSWFSPPRHAAGVLSPPSATAMERQMPASTTPRRSAGIGRHPV